MARRIRSQQQQQQPQQHKTLTKVNSGPGSPCETYLGSDKQLYCDKNLQQNFSRQSFNPYVCHSCLRGGQPVLRPVSLVAPEEAAHAQLVPRPSVKRSVSHHQPQRRHMRGAPVVRSGTVVTSGRPPSTKASASD